MGKATPPKAHLIKHIWEAYAAELLAKNPDLMGLYYDRTQNYYIYDKKTRDASKKITVRNDYPSGRRYVRLHSGNGLITSYKHFRAIVEGFFQRGARAVVQGEALNVPSLGKFAGKRVQRDFRSKRQKCVNWIKTRARPRIIDPVTGKSRPDKYIFYSNDDWCRIGWFNKKKIKNEYYYEFAPSNGSSSQAKTSSGFKRQFSEALTNNPLLKYKYIYEPIK